jgi:hypothetical protein
LCTCGIRFDPTYSRGIVCARYRAYCLKIAITNSSTVGFGATHFHDLRGVHATALLDAGIPVHTVAQRIGEDPATLLRNYVKRKRSKQADQSLATALASFSGGFPAR